MDRAQRDFRAMNFDYDSYSEKTERLKTTLTKERPVRRLSFMETMLRRFSPGERLALYALTILLGASALALLVGLNAAVSVDIPAQGGSLTEGETGPARFINPVLTLSQPDEDLSALVYSGLMRALPDGTIVPDLASSYQISPDGTTYTFTLRPDATFQDGTPVTAADVVFTVQEIQDPDIKSPHLADWEGVQVSSPSARTVVFKLPHAYEPFIENTTLGILPAHIWQNISAEEFPFSPANTHPIGSGPYEVASVATDDTGSATRYDLVPFAQYALGEAYVSRITFIFYPSEDAMIKAFNARQIDAIAGIAPSDLASITRSDFNLVQAPLPRVFGIFFNQSRNLALADLAAREALDAAVDKQAILKNVLGGYGVVLQGPIPPGVMGETAPAIPFPFARSAATNAASSSSASDARDARTILQKGGWTFGTASQAWTKGKLTLSLTLATADEPELVATAHEVASDWQAVGVKVTVQVYPLSELNTDVIRPRAYDAVLFGEVVGRGADFFAFWHSSQRNDPGLNLALYANANVDALLSQARTTNDEKQRDKLYAQFAAAIGKDDPAVFLYAPEFLYLVPKTLQGVELGALTSASERFLNVYEWYTNTARVWSVFTNRMN
jgi:peptide/nickel transport system substrate-binding protein